MARVFSNELYFPDRAENFDEYEKGYTVHLDHWAALADRFARALRRVHTNVTSRLLVIYGESGSGKSLFCKLLEDNHGRTLAALQAGTWTSASKGNLWELLAVDDPERAEEIVREATRDTVVHRVVEEPGWLPQLLTWAEGDTHRVRVIVFDNFDHVPYLAELAGVSLDTYLSWRNEGREDGGLSAAAQQLVTHARGKLKRSILVCTSNDRERMERFVRGVARPWPDMAVMESVPPLDPETKERIARTNLNRLNAVSYWRTLDSAADESLEDVHRALTGDASIGRIYERVGEAATTRYSGDAGRRHRFTLVTLGSTPGEVGARIQKDWEKHVPKPTYVGASFGLWRFGDVFARAITRPDERRRASLFDSEFEVRWVAFDAHAVRAMIDGEPSENDLGQMLLRVALAAHDRADNATFEALSTRLSAIAVDDEWTERFRAGGMGRAKDYEAALQKRAAFERVVWDQPHPGYTDLLPDIRASACSPCELHKGAAPSLRLAIARDGHVIEFTAFMRERLDGITDYLRDKIVNYATMLEEV